MTNPYEHQFEEALERTDLELAHKKALRVLEQAAIKEEDFSGLYGETRVQRDIDLVQTQENHFHANQTETGRENKLLADVFEAIVIEQGELNDWFGPNAFTAKTSRYDDYENGIDAVVEFEKPQEATHLGLGVDVTFSADTSKKFDRIRNQIESGRLPRIKYFSSERLHFRGELRKVPAVVIGASRETIQELIPVWMARDNKNLAGHFMQLLILKEIEAQLIAFQAYASKNNKPEIAKIYADALETIKNILQNKEELQQKISEDALRQDQIYSELMDYLKRWQKSFS